MYLIILLEYHVIITNFGLITSNVMEENPKLSFTYFIVSFVSIYFLMGQILEYFIYRKIKLIYKLISQTKASKREEAYQKYVLPKKGIDDVREDS